MLSDFNTMSSMVEEILLSRVAIYFQVFLIKINSNKIEKNLLDRSSLRIHDYMVVLEHESNNLLNSCSIVQ